MRVDGGRGARHRGSGHEASATVASGRDWRLHADGGQEVGRRQGGEVVEVRKRVVSAFVVGVGGAGCQRVVRVVDGRVGKRCWA